MRDSPDGSTLTAMLGEELSPPHVKLKRRKLDSFVSHFSEWEHENTLDVQALTPARAWPSRVFTAGRVR